MQRRTFIKQSCNACLGVACSTVLISLLQSCATLPVYKTGAQDGVMAVPAEQFAATNLVIVRNSKLEFDILVVKHENSYKALYMKCTHQDQPLTATADGLHCTAHGSSFDLEGNVNHEPATAPLTAFRTEIKNNSILIYI